MPTYYYRVTQHLMSSSLHRVCHRLPFRPLMQSVHSEPFDSGCTEFTIIEVHLCNTCILSSPARSTPLQRYDHYECGCHLLSYGIDIFAFTIINDTPHASLRCVIIWFNTN